LGAAHATCTAGSATDSTHTRRVQERLTLGALP
jgi:hypothetical protein